MPASQFPPASNDAHSVAISALTNNLLLELRATTRNVAAGINGSLLLDGYAFQLPELGASVHPLQNVPLFLSTSQEDFRQWIIANGVRDLVEWMSHYLEGARKLLASSAAGNQAANANDVEEFQCLSLASKLNYLRDHHQLTIDDATFRQLECVDRLRSCMTQRKGRVVDMDTHDGENFTIHLSRRVRNDFEEQSTEFILDAKTFKVGDAVALGLNDFAVLTWSLFAAAEAIGEFIANHFRALVKTPAAQDFVQPEEPTEAEQKLDDELAQTFPASDPLPWSHQVN